MAKVLVEENNLKDIANAIRDKNGEETKYKPSEMSVAISNIISGSSEYIPTEEDLAYSGKISYSFSNNMYNWILDNYKSKIKFNNITSSNRMFSSSDKLQSIDVDINLLGTSIYDGVDLQYMFQQCSELKSIKSVNIDVSSENIPIKMSNIFWLCTNLKDFDFMHFSDNAIKSFATSKGQFSSIFTNCYSMRELPEWIKDISMPTQNGTIYSLYYGMCSGCYALDKVNNLQVLQIAYTSNSFLQTFSNCGHLENLTFETNEDGSAIVAPWKSQTIDLSSCIGYYPTKGFFLNYNSGITADKDVKDDATYQALKNDSDWFTTMISYSRYNHDSAVRTINSLPDCSAAGGTNTIKFKGTNGSKTDGGAINTLTAEEIAVATAKGWTVTLV